MSHWFLFWQSTLESCYGSVLILIFHAWGHTVQETSNGQWPRECSFSHVSTGGVAGLRPWESGGEISLFSGFGIAVPAIWMTPSWNCYFTCHWSGCKGKRVNRLSGVFCVVTSGLLNHQSIPTSWAAEPQRTEVAELPVDALFSTAICDAKAQ